MASADASLIRRMVLVLDIDESPKLFVEMFLSKEDELVFVPLEAMEVDEPLIIDTSSMQSQTWRTASPKSKTD